MPHCAWEVHEIPRMTEDRRWGRRPVGRRFVVTRFALRVIEMKE